MSDGYCEVDFSGIGDDAEPCEFWDSKLVTAKKPHVCSDCGGPITAGERYRRMAYKFEGKFSQDCRCAPCEEAAGEFEYRLIGGGLWSMFSEEWDQGAHVQSCIARLTTARAKEHMRQQWLKWDEARRQRQIRALELRKARGAVDPHVGGASE